MQDRKSLIGQAFSMSVGTFLSRILGLLREVALVALFPRTVTDAFAVAFRLPNMFRRLLGEGSLSVSFLPVFMESLAKDPANHPKPEALRLMNGFFTLLLSILITLTLLGTLFSREILSVLVSGEGYMSIPGKFETTVVLAQIMFCFILLVSLYAYYMAIMNAFGKFGLPGFAPTLFNVALIISTLIPPEYGGTNGEYLAWGVVVGGILQMGVLIPSLYKLGYLPKISFDFSSPGIRQVFKAVIPAWIGVGILQMTVLINTYFASHLSEGSHTWIYAADRILELPLALFAVSMGSALLPRLSTMWAQNKKTDFLATTSRSLQLIMFVAIPAGVGCFMLAEPIVSVLLGRGRFGPHDVYMTSSILRIYALAVITYAGVRILVVPFYATKNAWLPALFSGASLLVHCGLGWYWLHLYGIEGLTASVVATSGLNLLLLYFAHTKFLGKLNFASLSTSFAKSAVAAAVMAAVLSFEPTISILFGEFRGGRALALFLFIGLGAASYFVISFFLRSSESKEVLATLQRRLNRSPKA